MYFRAAVVKGVLTAALELGFLYFDGRRIDPNPAEAVKWLEKAGAVDSGQALHLLSVMVYRGEGTPRNVERALDLFARAQADEHLPSLFNTLEKEVLRVRPAAVRQRDFAGMIRRAEEAAAEGDADAAFLAALAHWNGEADIPRDQDKARTFFRIAAEAGHVLAKACLSEALRQNGETEEADEWLREAAEAGLPQAENRIEALKRE
ncbi:MAG: sel1 repeat family protein [Acidobacteria bacterium]|nr:sel1 repeat family protein [Acidobacteriota bacterium]